MYSLAAFGHSLSAGAIYRCAAAGACAAMAANRTITTDAAADALLLRRRRASHATASTSSCSENSGGDGTVRDARSDNGGSMAPPPPPPLPPLLWRAATRSVPTSQQPQQHAQTQPTQQHHAQQHQQQHTQHQQQHGWGHARRQHPMTSLQHHHHAPPRPQQQQHPHPHQHHANRAFHQHRAYMPCTADSTKMESRLVFEAVWRRFEERFGEAGAWRTPREVVWLLGAPGAGKGVNTSHILRTRGLTKSFHMSGLLEAWPESRRLMDAGEMVPDSLVCGLLLEALLLDEPGLQDDLGFVVDGFPRTQIQVDFVKLLFDKLAELHDAHDAGPLAVSFPRPSFKVVVLYVDEETSIRRQLTRARVASAHNRRVLDAGAGTFHEERATDLDVEKCRKRYAIFRAHYAATLRLKRFFPFTLIDAMGSLAATQEQITKELRYQSSLDLGAATYAAIRHLPLARDLVFSARQELVMRLDGYTETAPELFAAVVRRIANDVLPVVRQSGLAGHAEYVTRSAFFSDNPVAVDMVVDVLTDRGFHVCYIREDTAIPTRVDPATGAVTCAREPLHRFRVSFETKGVRDDVAALEKAMELAARLTEQGGGGGAGAAGVQQRDVRISYSVLPEGAEPDGGAPAGDDADDGAAARSAAPMGISM